jgi:hypothetical protein
MKGKGAKMTKGSVTKPLPAAGSKPVESALVGGVSNKTERTNYKKGK